MKRVLLADGSPRSRSALRDALSRAGLIAATSSTAHEALASLTASPPDCLILDDQLPSAGWSQYLRLVRTVPGMKSCRIILLTESASRELVSEAIKSGVSDIVLRSPEVAKVVLAKLEAATLRGAATAPERSEAAGSIASPGAPPRAHHASALQTPEDPETNPAGGAAAPPWKEALQELRDIRPAMAKADLLERFDKAAELRALSPVVQSVLALTGNASSSLDQLSRTIRQDPAMSIRLLKMANSSVYARGAPVDTVSKAISRIGLSQIRETVMGMAVMDQFSNLCGCARVRADWFWEHSIACGLIATRLGRQCGIQGEMSDALFTGGLLHDIGRVLMAEELGDAYAQVIRTADQLGVPLEMVEARAFATTHADVTDRVLRLWKLPGELVNPIALHHLSIGNARRLAPQMIESVAIIGLANRLAHAMFMGSSGNDVISPIREHVQALNLRPTAIAEIVRDVPDEAADMRTAMLMRARASDTTTLRGRVQGQIGRPLNAVFIGSDAQADALGIAAACLAQPGALEFEVAIVSLHSPQEVAPLSRQLAAADPRGDLPVIVASPTAGLTLEVGVMEGRRAAMLPSPTPVHRLVTALRSLLPAGQAMGDALAA